MITFWPRKNIFIAAISATKRKLRGSKEMVNYLQFYSGMVHQNFFI
jgi:hypothetical protein